MATLKMVTTIFTLIHIHQLVVNGDDGHFRKGSNVGSSGSSKLFKWPVEKVGDVNKIQFDDGAAVEMVAKSLKPIVFQIDNFLNAKDCDEIIRFSEKQELTDSLEEDRLAIEKYRHTKNHIPSQFLDFDFLDENKNGRIDLIDEVQNFAYKYNNIYLNEYEVTEIFKLFRIEIVSRDNLRFIPKQEFMKLDLPYFFDYLDVLKETHPLHSDRHYHYHNFSIQSSDNPLFQKLYKKIKLITNIPDDILLGMEPIEVLKYEPYGHFFSHFESDDKEKFSVLPCCHHTSLYKSKNCRQCRFITIMVFLNEDSGPGEAVFPVADDPHYSYEKFVDKSDHDLANVIHHCDKSKLIIKPKTGSAIMWYNHEIAENGLLGKHDHYSLFGECNVYYNNKWVLYARVLASESANLINKGVFRPDYAQTKEFEHGRFDQKVEL